MSIIVDLTSNQTAKPNRGILLDLYASLTDGAGSPWLVQRPSPFAVAVIAFMVTTISLSSAYYYLQPL